MRIYFKLFLFFQLGINFSVSAQNCMEPDSFFRACSQKIYCLDEVLEATEDIGALCIKNEDLIPSLYGSLCLLDSILLHSQDSFKEKIKSLKSLYVYGYLPPNLIELLKKAPINAIMLRPARQGYKVHDFQSICLLKQFHNLSYIECADTSARLVECIQQFDQLDTLVWLNIYGQNPYLDRLTNITTLILHQYTALTSHNTVSNWNFWSDSILFNFPAQLRAFYTTKLSYSVFGKKLRKQCKRLTTLIADSEEIVSLEKEFLVVEAEHFPSPMPQLKKLTFVHRIRGGESRSRSIYEFHIPSDIEQFSSLKRLEISSGCSVVIPASFYTLPALEELRIVSRSNLSDSICYLKRLKQLDLSNYSLGGTYQIPDAISCLDSLEKLVLNNRSQKKAAFLPSSIYELNNLTELEVSPYLFSDSIRYLSKLRRLTMSGAVESDDLTSFPDSISCLKQLHYLEVGRKYKLKKFPQQIYKLSQLEELVFKASIKSSLLGAGKFREMEHLKYLECSTSLIKNEMQFRKIYKALPEHTILKLHFDFYKSKLPSYWGNVGLYMDYGLGRAIFTGIEFLHYITPLSIQAKRDKLNKSLQQEVKLGNMKIPPIFDFHTVAFGVEWNYLEKSDFLMGYRIGYNYSRARTPLSFQIDLIGYTNYEHVLDVRIAPRVAIPIKTDIVLIYLHYSYKMPLIPHQEQTTIARHNIGINFRFTTDWWSSLPLGTTYGF